MSLSKIYKQDKNILPKSEIYRTRPDAGDPEDPNFLALDSLWQSADTDYVETMNRLKKEQVRVERETKELLERTKAQVGQIEKEAFDKGFNAGKEEALIQENKKLEEMIAQFNQLVVEFESERKRLHDHYELDILSLVKLMVDRVLYHEVTVNPLVIEACLKTAMSYVVQNSKVKINLHKEDLERLQQAILEKPDLLEGASQVELSEDPNISQGGCFLETGFGEIDATLETRRDKIYKALDAIFVKALAGRVKRDKEKAEAKELEKSSAQSVPQQEESVDSPPLETEPAEVNGQGTPRQANQQQDTGREQPVTEEQAAGVPQEDVEAVSQEAASAVSGHQTAQEPSAEQVEGEETQSQSVSEDEPKEEL